ncbi:MAG: hypothetical protein ACE5HP_05560 [Gemmatimonadota bacterium]
MRHPGEWRKWRFPTAGSLRTELVAGLTLLVLSSAAASPQEPPLDTAAVGTFPHTRMRTLLEKTLFKVNVLTLEVRLGAEDAARIQRLLLAGEGSDSLEDSLASAAARSRDAFARIEFRRGVSLRRFVAAVHQNMRRARAAGYLTAAEYEEIAAAFPGWFAFLERRRIRVGDQLLYRIHGDTLRTVYRDPGGEVLLDQTDVGPERRLAVLGSYFAPGSDFRRGLIRSLLANRD